MSKKPYVIGITGGSGAGKTFFLRCFLNHFRTEDVCLISQDDYYIPVAHNMTAEENKLYNFDLPLTIDQSHFLNDIQCLLNFKKVVKKEYTFNNPNAIPKLLELNPAPIILIEGLFILHFKEIAYLMDRKIFIDSTNEVALKRRLDRDMVERGYSKEDILYKWLNHVVPSYQQYLLPYRDECSQIILNNSHAEEDIMVITKQIANELKELQIV
ncbi:MAG: uridine kinase [Flavobacterium sp.]|nr:uridine kinase [Pedobacter sp.]